MLKGKKLSPSLSKLDILLYDVIGELFNVRFRSEGGILESMNIVFLFSDEHAGAVMGNSGHPVVQTPHLDRLSEQSYTFDNAYCNSPICTPSRLSLLTGRYPHQIEAWDLGAILERQYPTCGDHLTEAGYETVLCGRTHFNGTDRLLGFRIACWTIYLGGGTQPVVHHDALWTRVEAPTRTSPSADQGTTNIRDMTETSQTWLWISFVKKRLHQTTNRSALLRVHAPTLSSDCPTRILFTIRPSHP